MGSGCTVRFWTDIMVADNFLGLPFFVIALDSNVFAGVM